MPAAFLSAVKFQRKQIGAGEIGGTTNSDVVLDSMWRQESTSFSVAISRSGAAQRAVLVALYRLAILSVRGRNTSPRSSRRRRAC